MRLSEDDLNLIFREARTANGFAKRKISAEQIVEVWELMKWGPTSANSMPARIVWCLSEEAKTKLSQCASASNAKKITEAPATAILAMDMEFYEELPQLYPAAEARSWFVGEEKLIAETALRNSSLQGAYLIIAGRSLGYSVGPMSGFDNAAVDAAFFAGTAIRSNFITTIGYPDPSTYRPRGPRLTFEQANSIE